MKEWLLYYEDELKQFVLLGSVSIIILEFLESFGILPYVLLSQNKAQIVCILVLVGIASLSLIMGKAWILDGIWEEEDKRARRDMILLGCIHLGVFVAMLWELCSCYNAVLGLL